jgi:hypothetical protein
MSRGVDRAGQLGHPGRVGRDTSGDRAILGRPQRGFSQSSSGNDKNHRAGRRLDRGRIRPHERRWDILGPHRLIRPLHPRFREDFGLNVRQ